MIEGSHMLVQDSPLAASDLGNLDCKKAAISLSSSRSLRRRTNRLFLFIFIYIFVRDGVPRFCTSCLMSPGWTGESSREERILIDMRRACCELTAASTHNLPLDPRSTNEGRWPLLTSLQSAWDQPKCHSKAFCHISQRLLISGDSQFNTTDKWSGVTLLLLRVNIQRGATEDKHTMLNYMKIRESTNQQEALT